MSLDENTVNLTNNTTIESNQQKKLDHNLSKLHKESFNVKFDLSKTKYEAIENIGTGAYGVVCKALNKKTKEVVAIKKIPGAFDNFLIAKRTYREIKILKHLKHDNIISIKDIIKPVINETLSEFKDVYVVFDLMESDLHRVIHSKQELTDDHIKYFLYQIMKALKYIHSAKIMHRDLKPSNILVNENCELKIGDFGMSRSINSSEDEVKKYNLTQYVATRWYRAPELMYSVSYDYAIDIWSVGCIFSELITSKPLFPCKDAFSLIKSIFGHLSVPNKQFLKSIESELFRNLICAAISRPNRVNFREYYPNLSNEGFDLLARLLCVDSKQRISALEALEHPYLTKYRDPITETTAESPLDFNFEKQEFLDECGNTKNLYLLKQAIISEADEFINAKTIKLFSNEKIQTNNTEEINSSSLLDNVGQNANANNEDLTNKILKIDEFLQSLEDTKTVEISNENNSTVNNNMNDLNQSFISDTTIPGTSFSAFSNLSSSISAFSDPGKSNVKSLLKQKIMGQKLSDSVSQKLNVKEGKNKRKSKHNLTNSNNLNKSLSKLKQDDKAKLPVKGVPIRPKPAVVVQQQNAFTVNPNLIMNQLPNGLPTHHQIYIHSNQPIIILNGALMQQQQQQQQQQQLQQFTTIQPSTTNLTEIKTTNLTSNSNNNNNNTQFINTQHPNEQQQQQVRTATMVNDDDPNSINQMNNKRVEDLAKLFSKSKVDDTNLYRTAGDQMPRIKTPRGTADGYSIGVNFNDLAFEIPGLGRNLGLLDDLESLLNVPLDGNNNNENNVSNNENYDDKLASINTPSIKEPIDPIDLKKILEHLDSPMVFSPS